MDIRKGWRALAAVVTLFILSMLVISCSTNSSKDTQVDVPNNQNENTIAASEWSDNLILTFKGNTYTVTKDKTNNIDKQIGTISYHGKNGEVFLLYSIINIKNYDKIAVKTKSGYLVATENHK